jgi:hypothetical protein
MKTRQCMQNVERHKTIGRFDLEAISQMPAAALMGQAREMNTWRLERVEKWDGRSLGLPQRCSSVTERCGYAPSSRLVAGPNLWPRHLRSFMR